MNLLIDIGNTRLKWAIDSQSELTMGSPFLTDTITRTLLRQIWQDLPQPRHIAIACVTSNRILETAVLAMTELWPGTTVIQSKTERQRLGITNAYPEYEKLGVDRWLSLIAAYQRHNQALCVVGCCTALTLDILDEFGKHLGGVISPGLHLMKEALANKTEQLFLPENSFPFGLAQSTEAAIYNGTLAAACGFIERILKNQQSDLQLVLTGGDAETIAAYLTRPALIDADLVLRGLALTLKESI